jgi:hypothetical protein
MSTTPHPIAPEEIMAHLDGELAVDRSQSVSAHIDSCPECRNLSHEFRQTKYNLAAWQVSSLPLAAETRIESAATKIIKPATVLDTEIFGRGNLWRRRQWTAGLAAAAIVTLAVLSLTSFKQKATPVDFARVNSAGQLVGPAAAPKSRSRESKLPEWQGLSGTEDRFQRAESKNSNVPESLRLKDKLEMFAQVQRPPQPLQAGPMIARTVSLSIVAKDFDASRASLDAILVRHNGYAANLTADTPQGAARTLQASLRIPAPQLPAALAELKSLGRVENESQNGEEVTQQQADLVARLKNSRETEQRLQAILTQRTGKISDVLEVEQEIARVRGEIEQMEAEQKNLEHRVDYATVDLKLSEEYKAKLESSAPAISTLIHNAAVSGYRNLADTLLSIVLFFAEYGPVLLFWAIFLFIPAWFVWRRWRHATAAL